MSKPSHEEKSKSTGTSTKKPASAPPSRQVSPPITNGDGLDFSDFQVGGYRSREEDESPRSQRDSGIGRQSSCESNEMLNDLANQDEYAYATTEFRPLVITENYAVSTAVDPKKIKNVSRDSNLTD